MSIINCPPAPTVPPASLLTLCDTAVHNGASPIAWTDLDLSAVVGAKESLVILKATYGNVCTIAFRRNGDTDNFFDVDRSIGCALGDHIDGTVPIVYVVTTDSAGIIEWIAENTNTAVIHVLAYLNLA